MISIIKDSLCSTLRCKQRGRIFRLPFTRFLGTIGVSLRNREGFRSLRQLTTLNRGEQHEKNIPTQQSQEKTSSRLFGAYGNKVRTKPHKQTPRQRPEAPRRLVSVVARQKIYPDRVKGPLERFIPLPAR